MEPGYVKEVVETLLKERRWIRFSDLTKYVNAPISEILPVIVELMRENKVVRKRRYLYYQG